MDETAPGLTTHELLQSLVQRTQPRLAFETRVGSGHAAGATLNAWQSELRAALWTVLGATPETHTNPALRVTQSVPCDGYTRHRVLIEGAHSGTIPAYALVPNGVGQPGSTAPGAPAVPGILCLHGHGANNAGKSLVAGTPADDTEAAYIESHGYDYAVRLARHGYVTLAPDALGFGERASDRTA